MGTFDEKKQQKCPTTKKKTQINRRKFSNNRRMGGKGKSETRSHRITMTTNKKMGERGKRVSARPLPACNRANITLACCPPLFLKHSLFLPAEIVEDVLHIQVRTVPLRISRIGVVHRPILDIRHGRSRGVILILRSIGRRPTLGDTGD